MNIFFKISSIGILLSLSPLVLVAQTESLKILPNGNVGIGTSNPSVTLEVKGDLKGESATFLENSTINNVFLGDVGHGANWAGFSHKNSIGKKRYGLIHRINGDSTLINIKSGKGHIGFRVDNNSKMVIKSNGNVGIGTENPEKGKLVIEGGTKWNWRELIGEEPRIHTAAIGRSKGIYSGIGEVLDTLKKTEKDKVGISIYTSGAIAARQSKIFSDLRIKNVKGVSKSQLDLKTLNTIQITDYLYKDVVTKGNRPYKKVIAQQVKKVYPQAVALIINEIPDIYQPASLNKGWVMLATNLKVGEKVQFIFGSEKEIFEVLEANKEGFKVATGKEGDVFVYGRQVNDFHSVDYDAISMLNVSATQELSKQIDLLKRGNEILKADSENLKRGNETLKTNNESLKKSNNYNQEALVKIQNRLQALENKPETKVVKTML